MAARVCNPRHFDAMPKADPPQVAPQPKFHALTSHTTHTTLQVCDDASGPLLPDNIDVNVFDPSKSINYLIKLKSTDTTDTLSKKYLEKRPELGGNLHLVFNGKPVPEGKRLIELGVKHRAVFITFQRCHGG